jgi:hypothetical protein
MEQLIWNLAIYISLIGLVVLTLTVLTGLGIIKIKPFYRIHKKLAIAAFIAIGIHASIMIFFYFFS